MKDIIHSETMGTSKVIKGTIFGIVLTAIAYFFLFTRGCLAPEPILMTVRPDTVYIDKPYKEIEIKEIEVEIPTKVYIYQTDTIYRKVIEKDTLISSIQFTPKLLKVHTITPKGTPLIKDYPLLNYKRFSLDHEGRLAIRKEKHPKRKKLLKTLGKVGLFVGGFYLGKEVYEE